jgi:hypothetical protein
MEYSRKENFEDFYSFYLEEHSNKANRILHFLGTTLLLIVLVYALITKNYNLIWLCPLLGYSFAWTGHFIFEKNRPATFKQPLYSLRADFVMWWQLLLKKIYF